MTMRVTFLFASDGPAPHGEWQVERITAVRGQGVPAATRVSRIEGDTFLPAVDAGWVLHGVRSHDRYVERSEKAHLAAIQPGLGRPDSRQAALIPIKKSDAWWDLAQDERRRLFEEQSRHIQIGAAYLPAIARRLYHCRDLGGPFDFLTWFEFAPDNAPMFADLLGRLRATEEWRYVTREVEIHLGQG